MSIKDFLLRYLGGRNKSSFNHNVESAEKSSIPTVSTSKQKEATMPQDVKKSNGEDEHPNAHVNLIEKLKSETAGGRIMSYHYSIGYSTEDWDYPIENNYYEGEEYSIDHHLKTSGIDRDGKRGEFKLQEYVNTIPAVLNSEIPFSSKNRGYYADCFPQASSLALSLAWAYIDVQVFDGKVTNTIRIEECNQASVAQGEFERLRQWLYDNINNKMKEWTPTEVDQLQDRSESYTKSSLAISGMSVENGKIQRWLDTSIERDIYDVSLFEVLNAMGVETYDDFFWLMREAYSFDDFEKFLEENNIHYAGYGF